MSFYQRPAFWRVPHNKQETFYVYKKKVHFNDEVQVGSPAQAELMRGDVITKINEYDSRDLTHEDAEHLFRTAGNHISLTIRRDNKLALQQGLSNGSPRSPSTIPAISPVPFNPSQQVSYPISTSTFANGPQQNYAAPSYAAPVQALPHSNFPQANGGGNSVFPPPQPPQRQNCFSPMLTRDYQQEYNDDADAINNQPYRSTPLILPGPKVKKDNLPTECYLRHHPNPAMRAPPQHDFHDILMKQKVADTVLHRVVGDEASSGKIVHKQFNSPIGLYSDGNIEHTIKQTVPTVPYKKTVLYDPAKSETYRALQEDSYGNNLQEVTVPVQPKVFAPNRLVPGKKPISNHPAPQPEFSKNVNSMGDNNEVIHQSNSFRRLMYHVLSETDY